MDYLFIDIECCDGTHMCEFGYCLTDDNFSKKESGTILIDPEEAFKLTGWRGKEYIHLHYKITDYKKSGPFPKHYGRIKRISEAPDRKVFGFAIVNDIHFLHNACAKYGLNRLKFDYVDIQKIFSGLHMEVNPSLQNVSELYGAGGLTLHKSEDDAIQTMNILKAMCERNGKTVAELLSENEGSCGRSKDVPLIGKNARSKTKRKLAEKNAGVN